MRLICRVRSYFKDGQNPGAGRGAVTRKDLEPKFQPEKTLLLLECTGLPGNHWEFGKLLGRVVVPGGNEQVGMEP